MNATGDRSKVRCCKEQYCIGTWNVTSMNPGKLEVVKQEMARVKVDILGISELKWTGKGEFNSDDHYIYYCGQEPLRRNGVAIMVKKRSLKCSTWMQSQKRQNDLCSSLRGAIQYHNNPSLCPNSNAEEAEAERLYEDLQDLVELTPQKRCPFYYRGVECRRRKSRNTWSNRQTGLGMQNEARQRLVEFCQEHALIIANILFQQHKRRLYT